MANSMLCGIVRIAGGTGFVVSENGLIATCAHVVEGKHLGDQVQVTFHTTGEIVLAYVEILRGVEDIAILRLDSLLPEAVTPLRLGHSTGAKGRIFETFGFPAAKPVEGMASKCEVIGETTQHGFPVLQLRAGEITLGYSGAPVWDDAWQVVIGIVTTTLAQDEFGKQGETAFIIPSATLRDACPALRIKEVCPYRGLAAFTEEDADFFFGRENLVDDLISHLRAYPRFLSIVGPSGSGKSSVVQAGLIPALRHGALPDSQNWRIVVSRPGSDPYMHAEWQTAATKDLPEDSSTCRFVLFIDQFEELFALCSPEIQTRFVEDLYTLIESTMLVTVILALRGDFYGYLQQSLLGEYLPHYQVNVDRITLGDLRVAIEQPAKQIGVYFEAGLVDTIAEETYRADHTLPLLQSALTQLWGQQENGLLIHAAYQKVGGVTGALGLWADNTYHNLSQEEQALEQRIFTRLVHYGEDSLGDTRKRVLLNDLAAELAVSIRLHGLVRRLATARLLVTDGNGDTETVEIIHDALLQEWGQLREWVNTQRKFFLWQQRLNTHLRMWEAKKRDESALLYGALLVEAEWWMEECVDDLSSNQCSFIQASMEKRKDEHAARERLQRRIIVGLSVGLLVLSVLIFVTLVQRNVAESERVRAEQQRNVTLAHQWAAVGQLEFNRIYEGPFIGTALGIESLRIIPSLEGDQLLRRGLSVLPLQVSRAQHDGVVNAVAFSPDGRWVVSAGCDKHEYQDCVSSTARVWESATGIGVARMQHDDVVTAVTFSPDGWWVVSGSLDGTVKVWEAATGTEVACAQHDDVVNAVALSLDGRWVVSAGCDKYENHDCVSDTVRVWEAATGTEVAHMQHDGEVIALAFSPNGWRVVSGSLDGTARVWDVATGTEVACVQHDGVVNAVAFSTDGRWVVSGCSDGIVNVWDVATGTEVTRVQNGHSVRAVAFSSNGRWVVSGGFHGTARVWEAATGTEVVRMQNDVPVAWMDPDGKRNLDRTFKANINAVAFSPDDRWVASGGDDGMVLVWDVSQETEVASMQHYGNSVAAVAFSPDGKWVVSGSYDCTARVWETATGTEVARMQHGGIGEVVALSPDGQWVGCVVWDGGIKLKVWEVATGTEVACMQHSEGEFVTAVAFSPDGQWVVTGSFEGTARVWEVATETEVACMQHSESESVAAVAFSPDGQWVVTGGSAGTLKVWEAATGTEVACIMPLGHMSLGSVAFSPDGQWVASGSTNDRWGVWEAATGTEVAFGGHSREAYWVPIPLKVALSPDGQWVVTGSFEGTARVWEVAIETEVACMRHNASASGGISAIAVAFSPDGRWVVSGGNDGTVKVWEAATGTEVARMQHHSDFVSVVAFSPDGKWVVSGGQDGIAQVWLWQPEDLIAEACTRLHRNLTREEWQQYIGDKPYRATCPNLPLPEERW